MRLKLTVSNDNLWPNLFAILIIDRKIFVDKPPYLRYLSLGHYRMGVFLYWCLGVIPISTKSGLIIHRANESKNLPDC